MTVPSINHQTLLPQTTLYAFLRIIHFYRLTVFFDKLVTIHPQVTIGIEIMSKIAGDLPFDRATGEPHGPEACTIAAAGSMEWGVDLATTPLPHPPRKAMFRGV